MSKLSGLLDLLGLSADQVTPFVRRGSDNFAAGANRTPFSKTISNQQLPADWEVTGYTLNDFTQSPDVIRPEDFNIGTRLMFGSGDRTATGDVIESINGVPLSQMIASEGGPRFMDRAGHLWASGPSQMAAQNNALQKALQRGEDVVFAYAPMGERSGDFSQHQFDALRAFVEGQRGMGGNGGPMMGSDIINGILGEGSPLLGDAVTGTQRAEAAKMMDTAAAAKSGAPDMGAIRWALTEPDLVDTAPMSVGYRFGRPQAGAPTIVENVHGTYGSYIPMAEGERSMTFGGTTPWWIGMRDIGQDYIAKRPSMTPQSSMQRKVMSNPNASQVVDQQWIDQNSEYLRRLSEGGRGAADAYAQSIFQKMVEGR